MDLLRAIDHDWQTFATSQPARRALRHWQCAEPTLLPLSKMSDLTDAGRDLHASDLDARDEIHFALLRLAEADDRAVTALLHLLYPALAATARRYSDTWEHDDASSQVVVAAVACIRKYQDALPRPAARIVRFVRSAMWRAAESERTRHDSLGAIARLDLMPEPPARVLPSSAEQLVTVVTDAVRAGVIDKTKAGPLIDSRVLGLRTSDLAKQLGCPASTIRQRRRRAEAAVAQLMRAEVA